MYAPPRSSVAPASLTTLRRLQRLLARLDRARACDQREVIATDLAPFDIDHGSLAVGDLRGGELVWLEDRHDPVDAGLSLQSETVNGRVLLHVADRADHGHSSALAAVRKGAGSLDLGYDRVNL